MTDRVSMRLNGRMPERFVGEALSQGIEFEEIERRGPREIRLTATGGQARRVQALAERYALDLTVEERVGWRLAAEKALRRNTLFFGLALCLALTVLFAGRVWSVEITAAGEALPPDREEALRAALREMGVEPAMPRAAVDAETLSACLLGDFPELTYAGVTLSGVKLTVEYRLEHAPPSVYEADRARSLYAARDAVIERIEPLAGRACAKPGDTVRKGDLLIAGEEKISAEETRPVRALGSVTGRVWFTGEADAPLRETVRTRTGRARSASALRLFSWTLALTEAEDFACQDEEIDYLPIAGLYLPLMIERRTLFEAREDERERARETVENEAREAAVVAARAKLPAGAEETDCRTDAAERGNVLRARAVIEARMEIAEDERGASGAH